MSLASNGFCRRSFLQVGAVSGLGLTLDQFFRLEARAAETAPVADKPAPAKSIIHIYLPGGMAHQDSFDPKPLAPIEYRGELGVIKTKLDGVFFNELLKNTANVADKIAVCRSMTHGEAAHERGTHNMFTGYRPSPALVFRAWAASYRMNLARATTCRLMYAYRASRPTSPAPATCHRLTPRLASAPIRPPAISTSRI